MQTTVRNLAFALFVFAAVDRAKAICSSSIALYGFYSGRNTIRNQSGFESQLALRNLRCCPNLG